MYNLTDDLSEILAHGISYVALQRWVFRCLPETYDVFMAKKLIIFCKCPFKTGNRNSHGMCSVT